MQIYLKYFFLKESISPLKSAQRNYSGHDISPFCLLDHVLSQLDCLNRSKAILWLDDIWSLQPSCSPFGFYYFA